MIIYLKIYISFVTKERPLVNRANSEESNEVKGFFERNVEYSNESSDALEAVGQSCGIDGSNALNQTSEEPSAQRECDYNISWSSSGENRVFTIKHTCIFFKCHIHETTNNILFLKLKLLLVPCTELHDIITAVWDLIIERDVSLAKEDRVSQLGHDALFKLSFKQELFLEAKMNLFYLTYASYTPEKKAKAAKKVKMLYT